MKHFDYCPFCGNSVDDDGIGYLTYQDRTVEDDGYEMWMACVECRHCMAQSGHFGADTQEAAAEQAAENWNAATRPNTLCHRVKRFFTQLEYDIRTCWGRR